MYGLIGYPLGHSFSAKYFTEKFSMEHIENSYRLFPLSSINEFEKLLISQPTLEGLNVTIPYKEKVIPYLDTVSPDATAIGAVNVIKISHDKTGRIAHLSGYNTDWMGFSLSLIPLLTQNIRSALVLGTGGASKAVVYALEKLGISVQLVSRTKKEGCITYSEITKDIIASHLLIVNTTPLGTFPDIYTYPDIPYDYLTDKHLCYDLVYNPAVTEFLSKSMKYKAKVKNGLEMLHKQAELSWKIWNGH